MMSESFDETVDMYRQDVRSNPLAIAKAMREELTYIEKRRVKKMIEEDDDDE